MEEGVEPERRQVTKPVYYNVDLHTNYPVLSGW